MDRYHAGRCKAPICMGNLVYRPYERVVRSLDGPRRVHPTEFRHAYVYKWRHGEAMKNKPSRQRHALNSGRSRFFKLVRTHTGSYKPAMFMETRVNRSYERTSPNLDGPR